MTDDELIGWFADIQVGTPIPERDEMQRRILRIARLGIIPAPAIGDQLARVCMRARDCCRMYQAALR